MAINNWDNNSNFNNSSMEHIGIAEVIATLGFVTLLLIGAVKWIFSSEKKKNDADIVSIKDEHQKLLVRQHNLEIALARQEIKIMEELKKITTNYLSRFDKMADLAMSHHEESIKEFSKLGSAIDKQFQYCSFVQEQKEKNGHS